MSIRQVNIYAWHIINALCINYYYLLVIELRVFLLSVQVVS